MQDSILREINTSVTLRTIENDLEFMKGDPPMGYGAPIEYDKSQKAHYYSEAFTLDKVQLSSNEQKALEFAASLLYQYRDLGFYKSISAAIDKVKWGTDFSSLQQGSNAELSKIIQTENTPTLKGREYIPILLDAIQEQKALTIRYQKFSTSESDTHTFHPYLLKEYLNLWYVVGFSVEREGIRSLALDRIKEITPIDTSFNRLGEFDGTTFFQHTIGITRLEEEPIEIVIRFTAHQGNYIKTTPLHDSQCILIDDENELRIRINIIPSYEFYMRILSFGDQVEIIEPQPIREQISWTIQEMQKKYS
jgi:predicted DNA-binding transcriptional regulator YafY